MADMLICHGRVTIPRNERASLIANLDPSPYGDTRLRDFHALLGLLTLMSITACQVRVYDLGLPPRGTRFTVPATAAVSPSPVVQSWVAYSLAKSTCQLEMGGSRPAANSSFSCELRPREILVKRWATRREIRDPPASLSGHSDPEEQDEYLDLLVHVDGAGYLAEYVWFYLGERGWIKPDWLRMDDFEGWRRANLGRHRPKTRIIGYWTNPT